MKDRVKKIINIKNLAIKLFLGFWGVVLVVGSTYPLISYWFSISDENPQWDENNVIGLGVGFFLAVGGYKYNTIIDKLSNKI